MSPPLSVQVRWICNPRQSQRPKLSSRESWTVLAAAYYSLRRAYSKSKSSKRTRAKAVVSGQNGRRGRPGRKSKDFGPQGKREEGEFFSGRVAAGRPEHDRQLSRRLRRLPDQMRGQRQSSGQNRGKKSSCPDEVWTANNSLKFNITRPRFISDWY